MGNILDWLLLQITCVPRCLQLYHYSLVSFYHTALIFLYFCCRFTTTAYSHPQSLRQRCHTMLAENMHFTHTRLRLWAASVCTICCTKDRHPATKEDDWSAAENLACKRLVRKWFSEMTRATLPCTCKRTYLWPAGTCTARLAAHITELKSGSLEKASEDTEAQKGASELHRPAVLLPQEDDTLSSRRNFTMLHVESQSP